MAYCKLEMFSKKKNSKANINLVELKFAKMKR